MKRIPILAVVVLLTIQISAGISVNSCKTISTSGSYELNTDILNNGSKSCINITASNITFDGKGHLIDGLDNQYTYGVYIFNPTKKITNVTVKNIITTEWHHGIFYHNTNNGNIINNTANMSFYGGGIGLENSTNILIQKNNANSSLHGISLLNSSNNKLDRNIATLSASTGIILEMDSNNNIITNNNVSNNDVGISVGDSNNNTINKNIVGSLTYGIELEYSDKNKVIDNNIYDNNYGIIIVLAPNNTLRGNSIRHNNYGIHLVNMASNNNNITNNTVLSNEFGIDIDKAINNSISNNNVSNNTVGISISSTGLIKDNNTLNGNNINNNDNGIIFDNTNYSAIKNNILKENNENINLSYSNNNVLNNNIIYNLGYYGYGIKLFYSNKNTLNGNTIHSTKNGLFLDNSEFNIVKSNKIYNNGPITGVGIFIHFANNNTIYNNYLNNSNNFNFPGATNIWNITKIPGVNIVKGPYIGGNFWAYPNGFGYSQKCKDNNTDGICDLAYIFGFGIDDSDADYLPLTFDKTPPKSITSLKNITYKPNYINWTWKDPSDVDFAKVLIYIDGISKGSVIKGRQYYNSTGFLPNTLHKISTKTVDLNGNINKTPVNKTAITAKDNIPPKSITNLKNITYKPNYINWTWKDPSDIDFAKVLIYINGISKGSVIKGRQYFNSTGLTANTSYRISTHTVDTSGNINNTTVNKTARTSPSNARVNISGFTFVPSLINVVKGTTITWKNMDAANHTVASDTGLWDSGIILPGKTYSRVFSVTGSYGYHCNVHPFMTGGVIVS